MKMRRVLSICMVLVTGLMHAQNFVPNYSFENYSTCPSTYNQVALCQGWFPSPVNNNPLYHTEYLHSCNGGNFSVPTNTWGNQSATTGTGYMALSTMAPAVSIDYRENIYTQLISPLTAGLTYTVTLKVSHTDNSQWATNNIGVKFSTVPNISVNNVSHVYTTNVITDQANWTTISGSFVADSNYTFIGVGNFFDDANSIRTQSCPSCQFSQQAYYIDDICVMLETIGNCSIPFSPAWVKEVDHDYSFDFTIFPNPVEDKSCRLRHISRSKENNFQLSLEDISGRVIKHYSIESGGYTGEIDLDIPPLPAGIYFICVSNGMEKRRQKVVIP